MSTCAFIACHEADACCLTGGCVRRRFGSALTRTGDVLKHGARALNGTRPARTNRDPTWMPRQRQAIAR